MDSNFHQHALSNGLALVGETNPSARAVGLAFWVRTGARDEAPPVAGVSHFLEHMVFKGTETRDSLAVNREFSQIGAESNAFTSEENTVYYAVILPEYLPRAVDILADIMRPSLRGNDFDMEKMVILDEIARYAIQPHWEVYEHARKNYFGEQPLGYSVLGSTESIQELKVEAMRDYFAQRYVPSNLHVIATGNYDWNQLTDLVAAKCGHWQPGSTARTPVSGFRPQPGIHMLPRPAEKVGQEYVMMLTPGVSASDPLRYAATVLSTVVSDDTNSRFYWALIDSGLAESVSLSNDASDGIGTFYITLCCDPEQTRECYDIILKILHEVQKEGVTRDELELAKTKLTSREVRSAEMTRNRMLNLGNDWAYQNRLFTVDEELQAWDAVSVEMVRELLDRCPLTQFTTTALGPLEQL